MLCETLFLDLLNDLLLLFKLLLHLTIRNFQYAYFIVLLIKHSLHYIYLFLQVFLNTQLNKCILVKETIEFIERASFPHLNKVLSFICLSFNLFIFREKTFEFSNFPQFVLLLFHKSLCLIFGIVNISFIVVDLRM